MRSYGGGRACATRHQMMQLVVLVTAWSLGRTCWCRGWLGKVPVGLRLGLMRQAFAVGGGVGEDEGWACLG